MIKSIGRTFVKLIPQNKGLFTILKKVGLPGRLTDYLDFTGSEYKVDIENGSFRMFSNGLVQDNRLFWRGLAAGEDTSIMLWQFLCKKNHVILDVGSNIGLFAIVAKAENPNAEVHAFEPIPVTYKMLKKNVEVNNFDINCHEIALSDKSGSAEIFMDGTNGQTPSLKSTYGKPIRINTRDLDSMAADEKFGKIDLMKIDVETYEPEVLEGMKNIIKNNKPTILIEVLNNEVGARDQLLLDGNGYKYFYIDEHKGLTQSDKLVRLSKSRNYLVCLPEVAESVLKQPFAKQK